MAKRKTSPPWVLPPEEIPEILRDVFSGMEAEGFAKYKKHSKRLKLEECKCLRDLARVLFDLVELDGEYQLLERDGKLIRWVWFGPEFGDKHVKRVERVIGQIADADTLEELRLVSTMVSAQGIELLHKLFPKAIIKHIGNEESSKNWQWSQASYDA